jgi:hypothetical protein
MPTSDNPVIQAQAERAARAKADAQERRNLAARNTKFGSRWTNAQPEPQHSGTILWIAVLLALACIVGVTLLRIW